MNSSLNFDATSLISLSLNNFESAGAHEGMHERQIDFHLDVLRSKLPSDLSEAEIQKLLFTEILRLQQREQRFHSLVKVAAQVAHDIRSPVSALQILLGSKDLPSRERGVLQLATERIKNIANDLLASEKSKNEMSSFNLADCLRIIQKEKSLFDENFDLKISKDELRVVGDSSSAQRMFSNLINNAFEAIPAGRIRQVEVQIREERDRVEVVISDNGKGIPESVLTKIGRRGFSYLKPSGNGLGLSHAMENMKAWGGDLKIESTEGVGTQVTLVFKIA